MKRRRLLLVAILVQLLLAALAVGFIADDDDEGPGPGPAAEEEPALTGNQALLSGAVTDEASKEPIAGAVLSIDHAGGPSTVRSGADGRYRAVVDASRPIGFTIDAPGHKGAVAFGKLCPKERKVVDVALPPAEAPGAPPAPMVLEEDCG